jgi:tetratricopeptide (TPR) repeat protein
LRHDSKALSGIQRMTRSALVALIALAALALPAAAQTSRAGGCGDLANGNNGPYDYRSVPRDQVALIENYHFTPEVEALIRGKSAAIGADIHYVLMVFPNHARALMAMMRLADKQKIPTPHGAGYSVDCYFERALRFRADDNVVRMTYAMFLSRSARMPEALEQLGVVTAKAGDNALTHFNAGLIYFEMKQYDKALAQAHTAMALGLPRTELREQLKSAGKWTEPAAAAGSAASAASAASPAAAASAP